MYKGQYDSIPPICITLEKQLPQYSNELERLRIEAIIRAGRLREAQEELKEALQDSPRPWMRLALARILMEYKEFDEAASLLEHMVKENPEYICAADLYADVLWEQDNPEMALDVLEKLGSKALSSTSRLRKLADLALRLGDKEKSKLYLTKAIERSGGSSLTQIHDYLQLTRIFSQEGLHNETEKLVSRLRSFIDSSEMSFVSTMIKVQRLIDEGNLIKARAEIEIILKSCKAVIDKLQPDAQTCLLEQCFKVGMSKEGDELIEKIRKCNPGKAILERIRESQKLSV